MEIKTPISHTNHSLLIDLNQAKIEDIVEKKLLYFLDQKPLQQKILKVFCEPVEQALIEILLRRKKGNQLKTAEALGINRNTLKRKILNYKLDITRLLLKEPFFIYPSRLFLSSIASLDLLTVSRTKLHLDNAYSQMPRENILSKVCLPVEERVIQISLKHFKYNKIRTASILGLNRNTLKRKLSINSEAV